MAWFKVDDKLHDHRKARAAGATAMGVWLLAGSWAADNLTDGFVPASVLRRWGRPRDAERLVEVGLWHATEQDGEAGWRFHEWLERQPSRAQKLAEREVKAQAGRIGGLRSGRSRREANGKQAASPLVEPPSRPVPTRTKDLAPTESLHTPTLPDERGSQTLVAEWIDHCHERPPSRVIGHIAKEVATLLDDGIDYQRVRAGLAEWNTRDLHPSVLPSIVHGLANRQPRAGSKRAEDEAMFERQMERAIAREAGQA